MRVEIYPMIDDKIRESAKELNITPTELINNILDSVKIIKTNDFNSKKFVIDEMSEADKNFINDSLLNSLESNSSKSKKTKKK